mmetsp:Transcript_22471/g.41875  ORF Transcript_22471/g.41875 Transcript_22471/m.41875 type:complete len:99 (+) Transcript_22471:245-541(+)
MPPSVLPDVDPRADPVALLAGMLEKARRTTKAAFIVLYLLERRKQQLSNLWCLVVGGHHQILRFDGRFCEISLVRSGIVICASRLLKKKDGDFLSVQV